MLRAWERQELEIMSYVKDQYNIDNFEYRNYNPNTLKLLKPTTSINRLIGSTLNVGLGNTSTDAATRSNIKTNQSLFQYSNVDYNSKPKLTKQKAYKPSPDFV